MIDHSGSEIGYFHTYQEASQTIDLNVWSRSVYNLCRVGHTRHYPLQEAGNWADAIRQRKPVFYNDYESSAHKTALPEGHVAFQSHLGLPIECGGKIVAIIGVGNREGGFNKKLAGDMHRIAERAWPLLQNRLRLWFSLRAKRRAQADAITGEQILVKMMGAIGRALETRDEYTSEHQSNVSFVAERIAERLDLNSDERYGLKLGAAIHDIGKISIPSAILTKPSKLSPAERLLLQEHPATGAQIFEGISLPWPIQEMIEQHHERLDGSGYPNGLTGEQIILEARIIAVADTFDAMASDRPYRHAPGRDKAVAHLVSGRGTLFDAYVVDALLDALETDPVLKGDTLYPHRPSAV